MRFLDCTLRDGANVVGNGFNSELTLSIVKGLLNCGIPDIELGNAKGIGSYDSGALAPLNDLEYMKLVAPYASKGRLGMFILSKNVTEERVSVAKEQGLYFLRVGNNASDGASSLKAIETVKKAGLYCRYSLMKAYVSSPEELARESKMLEDAGVDCITIMDSAGTMFPDEVVDYTAALTAELHIPVGFHGHSNLGLSQANALAAAKAGAGEIDGGLLGMARSAGNCATEIAIATLQKAGFFHDVDLYRLLDYLDDELIPLMKPFDYHVQVNPTDLILGLSGCHSSFLNQFHEIATLNQVNVRQLIVEVSKLNRKNPSVDLIQKIAQELHNA